MVETKVQAPGLKYRRRVDGREVPIWCARPDAIATGFPVKTFNLSETPAHLLAARCEQLWREMLGFVAARERPLGYDGTLDSVFDLYEKHPQSPYRALKPSSRKPYDVYLRKLRKGVGRRPVPLITGLDVLRWHEVWRAPAKQGEAERLAAATTTLAVLKAAVNWAIQCGVKECRDLRQMLGTKDIPLRVPSPKPRAQAPSAADIDRARTAAHALGRHGAAFGYALQFETVIRQWDLVGQWVPLSDKRPSSVLGYGQKWIGPTWASIDERMVLSYTPTKTEETTGKRVHATLTLLPMVMDELQRIPSERRSGPLIVNERTGLPYWGAQYAELWAKVRARAGLSPKLWNRDIRAGGLTEGGEAGASADDRAKLAGHADDRMVRSVYDRDVLVGTDRVAEARAAFRKGKQ